MQIINTENRPFRAIFYKHQSLLYIALCTLLGFLSGDSIYLLPAEDENLTIT